MNADQLAEQAARLSDAARELALKALALGHGIEPVAQAAEPFLLLFTIFVLACFVGYYVVWNVTPALHSPLMSVTNAISSVIVVGAMLATGLADSGVARFFGFLAVVLASVNIFGGFLVTRRMLQMFRSKR
jgi:NAD(P) transhydrogenase subunit alpha